ncbi:hypothetical protein [Pseudogemmobacter hezensis]|uniref:hypothetical protein n=1 Tax=Pseudogemmobacter hezensis TaxID=2737662 RepID=UPI0020A6C508|nr:hypothetical protein [Pseudogemmobacter hezensis]
MIRPWCAAGWTKPKGFLPIRPLLAWQQVASWPSGGRGVVRHRGHKLPAEVHRVRAKLADDAVRYYFNLRHQKKSCFWKDDNPFPTDPAFFTAYLAARETGKPKTCHLASAMVDAYLSSAEFKDDPAAMFEEPASRGEVNEWRQQWAHSAKQFDYAGTVVTLILNWARDAGKVAEHHCDRLPKAYKVDRAEVVWTEADLATFTAHAPE